MEHHTKEKGDIGVAKVIADLSVKGLKVLAPLTEHLPFDLVAYDRDKDEFYKIQCKYKTKTSGKLQVNLRTSYATKNGSFSSRYSKGSFDVLAIYCPETDKVYYVTEEQVKNLVNSITLRIDEAGTSVSGFNPKEIRRAYDYELFPFRSKPLT